MNGGTYAALVVNAPNSAVRIEGNADIYGSIVGKTVTRYWRRPSALRPAPEREQHELLDWPRHAQRLHLERKADITGA